MKKNVACIVFFAVLIGLSVFLYSNRSQEVQGSYVEYKNKDAGFSLSYPSLYNEEKDTSGWPHALLLLDTCKGCSQSYDIVVESWGREMEWQKDERISTDPVLVVKVKDVYMTVSYQNNAKSDAEKIAQSFTLLDNKETGVYVNWRRK